jgi:hypothetical protein
MQGPDNNRITSQLFHSPSNQHINPSMIQRTGNPFGLDHARNNLAGYSFPSNSSALGNLAGLGMMAQFPPQRLQLPFNNNSTLASLSILSDMAVGDLKKRAASDDFRNAIDAKRRKLLSPASSPATPKETPIMMQRLSSMSGGFPMPKWAKSQSKQGTAASASGSNILPRHGAFPMPPLCDGGANKLSNISLRSYRQLWEDTDADLREEVLARRLERPSKGISQRK